MDDNINNDLSSIKIKIKDLQDASPPSSPSKLLPKVIPFTILPESSQLIKEPSPVPSITNSPIISRNNSPQCYQENFNKEFPSPARSIKASPIPSPAPSVKASPIPSPAPSVKASPIPSPVVSVKASPIPSPAPSVKESPAPSVKASPIPSPTHSVKQTQVPSSTPSIKQSPIPSPAPSIKASPIPSPAPSIKASPIPSPAPSVKASPIPSPAPSVKASPIPSVKESPAPSIKASPIPSPAPSIKASPIPSPAPSIKASPIPSIKELHEPSSIIIPLREATVNFTESSIMNKNKLIEITTSPEKKNLDINDFKSLNKKLNEIKVEEYMKNKNSPSLNHDDEFVNNYENEMLNHNVDENNIARISSTLSCPSEYNNDELTDDEKLIKKKKNKLIDIIEDSKKKIDTNLYIVCSKYDLIYFRYNRISLLILIISTITTFTEAFRLTLVNYYNNNDSSGLLISLDQISLFINIISLILGTLLTILSSIVKFRNYRENMEKLKNSQAILFTYKGLFNKQKELIEFFDITKALDNKVFMELEKKIEEYNKEVRDVNIFENIRLRDRVKFNGIKVDHDLQLARLAAKKELGVLKLSVETNNKKERIKAKEGNYGITSCICFPI